MGNRILKEMVDVAPTKVTSCSISIQQIENEVESLNKQATAIKEGMMDVIASDLLKHLNEKWHTEDGKHSVQTGGTFNQNSPSGTLTDWWVIETEYGHIVYQYNGTGWDGDEKIIKWISDWNWALDYLWRSMGTSGTYGIYDKIAKLNMGKAVVESDKSKYNSSIELMTPYAST